MHSLVQPPVLNHDNCGGQQGSPSVLWHLGPWSVVDFPARPVLAPAAAAVGQRECVAMQLQAEGGIDGNQILVQLGAMENLP